MPLPDFSTRNLHIHDHDALGTDLSRLSVLARPLSNEQSLRRSLRSPDSTSSSTRQVLARRGRQSRSTASMCAWSDGRRRETTNRLSRSCTVPVLTTRRGQGDAGDVPFTVERA